MRKEIKKQNSNCGAKLSLLPANKLPSRGFKVHIFKKKLYMEGNSKLL